MTTGISSKLDPFMAAAGVFAPHDATMDVELDFEADLRATDAWRESQLMQETGGLGSMAKGVMRPGGRHTIVCKHWLRDLCMKGDKCDFLHQYDLARMPECLQWSRFGKCADQECDFRHDTERMECQKYKFGFCKLGNQCKMRHDKLGRAYLPEVMPDWYLKELIPNIFDFIPRLPEEAVRVTNAEDLAPPTTFAPPPMFAGAAWAPQADAWAAPAPAPWQPPAQDAWSAPPAVVDLTDDRGGKGGNFGRKGKGKAAHFRSTDGPPRVDRPRGEMAPRDDRHRIANRDDRARGDDDRRRYAPPREEEKSRSRARDGPRDAPRDDSRRPPSRREDPPTRRRSRSPRRGDHRR